VRPRETAIAGFRRALSAHLPDYMLPQALVEVDALPVTRNGKLDRNALQELPWENLQPPAKAQGVAPRTPLESQVASAFAKALGVAEVGIDDDFFDSGGHSLLAVALVLELEKALGLNLPPGVIFDRPTVREIAEQAEGKAAHVVRPVALNSAPGKPALFMVMGVQLYKPLAKRLEPDYAVFGVYCGRELLNPESTESFSVSALAGDYIQIIRQQQPAGPYRIGGISFGGVVAYEVAQQLREAGEAIEFLALMDAVLPERGLRYRIGQIARVLALPPREMVRVAADRLQTRFPRLFKSRPKSEFIRYATEENIGAIEQERMSSYADASIAYAPTIRPYPGKVELIVAGRRIERDPSLSPACGWRGLAAALNVHVLDGDHFDLVEEPTVTEVAEIFLRSLRSEEQPNPKFVGYTDGDFADLDLSDGVLDPQT
jgi:thioesterase domain-containing protein/acyl carrier protein